MAVTATLFNHSAKLFANSQVILGSLRVMLLNNASFDATATNINTLDDSQVSGSGWDVGGEALANAAVTVTTTNDAKLDADDISVTASGGAIGPADAAIIITPDGNSPGTWLPLVYIDFGEDKTADDGTPFNITWNASGIVTWTVT